jgi:phosphatidate phosphatase APP1
MLSVQLFEGEHRAGRAEGKIHLLPREGLSVISDIDDTIKESHVGCRRSLLQNTFLREFATVAGMAEVYRQWAAEGAAFHYVSSSPWQLYGHLADWREQAQFPDGSFHLRCFRLRDHLFRRLLILRRSGKAAVLANLLRLAPQRRFVLVGDSGEHDPEIYGALARRFPRQVERILIRSLPSGKSLDRRIAKAFRQISPSKWQVYETSDDLPQSLLDAAVTR